MGRPEPGGAPAHLHFHLARILQGSVGIPETGGMYRVAIKDVSAWTVSNSVTPTSEAPFPDRSGRPEAVGRTWTRGGPADARRQGPLAVLVSLSVGSHSPSGAGLPSSADAVCNGVRDRTAVADSRVTSWVPRQVKPSRVIARVTSPLVKSRGVLPGDERAHLLGGVVATADEHGLPRDGLRLDALHGGKYPALGEVEGEPGDDAAHDASQGREKGEGGAGLMPNGEPDRGRR